MLGGDHTATLPVIEVLAPAIPDLRVLQLDAHPDLREEFLGERYNYASAMARVMDVVAPERVFQVGMRTGARGGVPAEGAASLPGPPDPPGGGGAEPAARARAHPLYVTIDVDVLDPSEAPGHRRARALRHHAPRSWWRSSACSSPAGSWAPTSMEVAHAWDPSGRTGITASWILREAILTWFAA